MTRLLIEAVITLCLANDPGVCKVQKFPMERGTNPLACMHTAIMASARLAEQHPGWEVRGWTCRPAGSVL